MLAWDCSQIRLHIPVCFAFEISAALRESERVLSAGPFGFGEGGVGRGGAGALRAFACGFSRDLAALSSLTREERVDKAAGRRGFFRDSPRAESRAADLSSPLMSTAITARRSRSGFH